MLHCNTNMCSKIIVIIVSDYNLNSQQQRYHLDHPENSDKKMIVPYTYLCKNLYWFPNVEIHVQFCNI